MQSKPLLELSHSTTMTTVTAMTIAFLNPEMICGAAVGISVSLNVCHQFAPDDRVR